MPPSISILIPAYNEEAGLEQTVKRCQDTLKACTDDYEIVILDDASKDKTVEIMERLRKADPEHIRTLMHEKNQGIAMTFEELYHNGTKDYLFLVSGDGEYPPEPLKQIMPMLGSYDVVICHRRHEHYTLYRHLITNAYRWLTVLFFGVDLFDPGSVKVVKREIFTSIPVTSKSVYVEAERMVRAAERGYRIGKIDTPHETRKGGKAQGAKWSSVWKAGKDVLRLWWELIVMRRKA